MAKVQGRSEARIPLEAVRAAAYGQHADATKAIQELGYAVTPLPEALTKAVTWFRSQGYLRADT